MCFSAEASFAVGAGLIPAAGYCVYSAWRKRPEYLSLAVVPLFFGIQQISEGFVWLGLHNDDPTLVRSASMVFLFFALALWPFWFPFLAVTSESDRFRRRFFIGLTVVSSSWFWILYYPLIGDAGTPLVIERIHHSIYYDISALPVYRYISATPLRVLYFLCVALPMAIGSSGMGRWPGILFGLTAVFAAIVYSHAFVSVWCFFAAVLTFYLVWVFHAMQSSAPQHDLEESPIATAPG